MFPFNLAAGEAGGNHPVAALIERVAPGKSDRFVFGPLEGAKNGQEFAIEAAPGGRIRLLGNSTSDQVSAFGWYLKHHARGHLSSCGNRIPAEFPQPAEPVRRRSPYRIRHAYNFCVFGYTSPFWDWERWEREIDFLASNGMNAMLVTAGAEEVWHRFLTGLGCPQGQVDAFIAHPAFSPWWHMGNLEGEGGPLSPELRARQAELGKKIVSRCRELGITPIVVGFVGLLPHDIDKSVPGLRTVPQGQWVAGYVRPTVIDPTHESFPKLAAAWYAACGEVYGAGLNAFAGDLFHEGGNTGDIPLQEAARAVQAAMQEASPGSTWFMQNWQNKPPAALVAGTDPKTTVISQLCRNLSDGTNGGPWRDFQGRPWLWGELANFGGNHGLYGGLPLLARLPSMLAAGKGDVAGLSLQSEGVEQNPIHYDLFFDLIWRSEDVDLDAWIGEYVRRRYGRAPDKAVEAWKILARSVYNPDHIREGCLESILCAKPGRDVRKASTWSSGEVPYDPSEVLQAARALLAAAEDPVLAASETYRYDLVDVTRNLLSDFARPWLDHCFVAYDTGDAAAFAERSELFLDLIRDTDRLLATHGLWQLGYWTEPGWKMGHNAQDRAQCLAMSKQLITTWSGRIDALDDYSHRQFAGLMEDYYLPRWRSFFELHRQVLAGGADASRITGWYQRLQAPKDLAFAKSGKRYPTRAAGDTIEIATEILEKYSGLAEQRFAAGSAQLGQFEWKLTREKETFTFDVSDLVLKEGRYLVRVRWQAGQSALKIHSVSLFEGEQEVAKDEHEGWTGFDNRNNSYLLKLPEYRQGLEAYTLKVRCSAASSIDSRGTIELQLVE